jgi:hypothetical protein
MRDWASGIDTKCKCGNAKCGNPKHLKGRPCTGITYAADGICLPCAGVRQPIKTASKSAKPNKDMRKRMRKM